MRRPRPRVLLDGETSVEGQSESNRRAPQVSDPLRSRIDRQSPHPAGHWVRDRSDRSSPYSGDRSPHRLHLRQCSRRSAPAAGAWPVSESHGSYGIRRVAYSERDFLPRARAQRRSRRVHFGGNRAEPTTNGQAIVSARAGNSKDGDLKWRRTESPIRKQFPQPPILQRRMLAAIPPRPNVAFFNTIGR